jgi:hypothetical protein
LTSKGTEEEDCDDSCSIGEPDDPFREMNHGQMTMYNGKNKVLAGLEDYTAQRNKLKRKKEAALDGRIDYVNR